MLSQMTQFDSDMKEKREMRIFARKKLAPTKVGLGCFVCPYFVIDRNIETRRAFNSKHAFRGMTNFCYFPIISQRRILTISTQIRNQKIDAEKKSWKTNKQTKQRMKEK